jgi:predicted transcriptional regulator
LTYVKATVLHAWYTLPQVFVAMTILKQCLLHEDDSMKNIVILGAGTGGAIMANMLTHRLNDLMTRNPVTIGEGDTLQRAVNLMSNNSIKRLLVTDEQRQVKGIVSRADLMKLFTTR